MVPRTISHIVFKLPNETGSILPKNCAFATSFAVLDTTHVPGAIGPNQCPRGSVSVFRRNDVER